MLCPKNGGECRGSVGDGVEMIRNHWSSLRRLTFEHLVPARRARSGEELRATDSEASLLPLSRGGQSHPFLPRYESTGSCCLCPQTSELLKKGLNQSAPSVFSPAPCSGKEDHQSMESPIICFHSVSFLSIITLFSQ